MEPQDYRYTKDHEWVKLEGDRGTVGITDYAQKQLGDVVFVELPEAGGSVEATKRFGTVESVKAVSELYSPVTGQVLEVNVALLGRDEEPKLLPTPELINSDPYGAGWMIVVKISDPGLLSELMDAAQYRAYVESESK